MTLHRALNLTLLAIYAIATAVVALDVLYWRP